MVACHNHGKRPSESRKSPPFLFLTNGKSRSPQATMLSNRHFQEVVENMDKNVD